MELQPVGTETIIEFLKDMKGSHSYGHEGIDSRTLKIVAESIAAPIAHLVNLTFRKRKFPNRWKLGRIVPIHKGGDKSPNLPESYRPISLLPATSKLVEKVVQAQLNRHMDKYGLWNQNLQSYRKSLSSATALAQVMDTAIEASEDKDIAATIAIDESAAFDSIAHPILLEKLRLYRLHEDAISWIEE